jgi:tetratricopeptide (TPR) repeat protein
MADSYFNKKEFKDNLNRYEAARNAGSSVYLEPEELTDIAEYYHSKGQLQQAMETIDYAISVFPGATAPLVFRSRAALLEYGNAEEAEMYAEQIADKADLDYFYLKAEILIVDNKIPEADDFLKNCYHEIDKEEREDFVLDVANMYTDYNLNDMALLWLQLSEDKESEDYQEAMGRISIGQGNYEEGERIFNELLDKHPYDNIYWNSLASSQYMSNNIQDSITSSEFSLAINPDDEEALLNKANGLLSLGNNEEALEYYQRYSKLCPNDFSGELFQGIALANLDRPQEAIEHLQQASRLLPKDSLNHLEIYLHLVFLLSRHIGLDKALEYVDKAEREPNSNQEELMVLRGHLYAEHGKQKEAAKWFSKAVRHSHEDPVIMYKIAISLFESGYLKATYRILKLIFETVGDDWDTGWSYYAVCCKELNLTEEFMKAVKRAIEVNPQEAKAVLGDMFPDDLQPKDYYKYLKNKA